MADGGAAGSEFGDRRRRTSERRRVAREVMEGVRLRGAGRTRQEIAALITEEYTRRGIAAPVPPYLDVVVDAVVDGDGAAQRAQVTSEVVTSLVRGGFRLARWLRENASDRSDGGSSSGTVGDDDLAGAGTGDDGDGVDGWDRANRGYHADMGELIAVDVDPAGAAVLGEHAARSWLKVRGVTTMGVDLRPDPDGGLDNGVLVEVDGTPVGRIGPAGAARFAPAFAGQLPTQLEGLPPSTALHTNALYLAPRADRPLSLHVPAPMRFPDPGDFPTSLHERLEGTSAIYFFRHCVVCARPVDILHGSGAYVTRPGPRIGPWSPRVTGRVTVHDECRDRGRQQAAEEGLHWEDAPPFHERTDAEDGD